MEHIFAWFVTNDIEGNGKRIDDPEAKEIQSDTDHYQAGDMYLCINQSERGQLMCQCSQLLATTHFQAWSLLP